MTPYDSLWQLLTTFDKFWQLMTAYDNFWQLMSAYDNLWQLKRAYNNLWQLMKTFDNFWQLLTTFDNYWQLILVRSVNWAAHRRACYRLRWYGRYIAMKKHNSKILKKASLSWIFLSLLFSASHITKFLFPKGGEEIPSSVSESCRETLKTW